MTTKTSKSWAQRFRRATFRFFIYGSMLVAGEVSFYSMVKIGRELPSFIAWLFQFQWAVDDRLHLEQIWYAPIGTFYGQASLWMFFVYGSIALFGLEPAYHRVNKWPWYVRGSLYMLIILTMECSTGWILKAITGYDIWYYQDGVLNILRYTSLAIAPMWFALGLISENFIHLVDKLTRTTRELANHKLVNVPNSSYENKVSS
ncbi:MAG: hypothetical protein JW841_04325 [Deltaproteobacteria bacterium]|nr:hypothetical protein [Deltaproteobacteria bacterium]